MEVVMRYRGRVVTDEEVVFIRQFIAQNSGDSRWMLSRKLCRLWGWVQPNGALRDMVCRGLMVQLERGASLSWLLPTCRGAAQVYRFGQGKTDGLSGLVIGSPSHR